MRNGHQFYITLISRSERQTLPWAGLATYWIAKGNFEMTRDVFEKELCHDCTGFHSCFRLEFEESIIGNLMEVDKSQNLVDWVGLIDWYSGQNMCAIHCFASCDEWIPCSWTQVQHGVLNALSFLFENIGEMEKDYVYAATPLLEDTLIGRDQVHRQTTASVVKHIWFELWRRYDQCCQQLSNW